MVTRTKCKEEMGFGRGQFLEAFQKPLALLHESFFKNEVCMRLGEGWCFFMLLKRGSVRRHIDTDREKGKGLDKLISTLS